MSLTIQQIRKTLSQVKFSGFLFLVHDGTEGKPSYLQAKFEAPCSISGKWEIQHTRKWLLSPHMTTSEVVQTAFKCVLTCVEHEAREHFTYKGQAIFGPHFDVEALVELATAQRLDARPSAPRNA